jgi:hypothetical protein
VKKKRLLVKAKYTWTAGGVAQVVENLPTKCKAPGPTRKKKVHLET